MILYSDRYFDHVYEVQYDMLSVKWMTIESLYLPEILHSVQALIDTIKNYNIRFLLIDASLIGEHSSVGEDQAVVAALFTGLVETHLEKLARIQSGNYVREAYLKNEIPMINFFNSFEVSFFKDVTNAEAWLKEMPVLITAA